MDRFRNIAQKLIEENAPLLDVEHGATIDIDNEDSEDDSAESEEEEEEDSQRDDSKKGKGKQSKKKDDKGAAKEGEDDDKPSLEDQSMGMIKELLELFHFATENDKAILYIGTFFTAIHGAGFPLLALLFGSMSNAFIQQSLQGFANETDFNETNPHINNLPTFTTLFEKFATKLQNTSGAQDVNFFENFEPLTKSDFVEYVSLFAWYYIYIGIIVGFATFVQVYCWEYAAENQIYLLRKKFLEQVLKQEIGWFDTHSAGDLTIKLADDIERIREGIGHKFSMVLEYLVTFGIGCGLGAMMNKDLTLILMSTTPLIIAKTLILTKLIASRSVVQQEEFGEAGAISSEVLTGVRTVAAFGTELREMERFADELEDGVKAAISKYHMIGAGTGAMYLLIYGSYALAFWYGCNMLLQNKITPGDIFTVFFSASMATFALGNILPFTSTIAVAYGSTRILMPILKSEPTIDASSLSGKKPTKILGSIKFADVSFAYPSRPDRKVLKDFTLELPAGFTYAMVGRSGSGKTSILNLLMRFYDPQSGGISIDSYYLKKLNTKWLRNNIGVVAQNPVFQQGTIWENIRAGRKQINFEKILQASKCACSHDFIKELPQGYNTVIGITGKQLSTSQRQCLAIARALVLNPPILILDEATACLDKHTANTIHANIRRLRKGKTTLVIAHRLSTIRHAHVIYVLKDGEIAEFGFHEQLLKKNGLYARMVAEENLSDQISLIHAAVEEEHERHDPTSTEVEIDMMTSLDPSKRPDRQRVTTEDIVARAEKIANLPDNYPSIWTTLSYTIDDDWKIMLFGLIGCILSGMIVPIFALYYGEIFKTFSKTGDELMSYAIYWVKLLVLLAAVAGVGYWLRGLLVNWAGESLALRLRVITYINILRQPISWFDYVSNAPGRLYTRLAVDPPFVKAAMGSRLGTALSAIVSVFSAVIITLVLSSRLAILLLIAIPIFLCAVWGQSNILMQGHRKAAALMESALRITTRAIQDIWTVQCLSRERDVAEKFNEVLEPAFYEGHRQAFVYSTSFALSEGLVFVLLGVAFRFGAHLIDTEVLEPKSLFKIFFALAFCFVAIGQATSFIPDFSKARLAAALLDRLMNLESAIDPLDDEGLTPAEITGHISFNEVVFSYPTRPTIKVLKGINFEIPPGACVGIIGGDGKSTLLNLLLRFYDVNDGHISLDGVDIREMNVAHLRSQFGIVPQEINLFNISIADNIGYGYQSTEEDEADPDVFKEKLKRLVEDAAEAAGIKEFIESLPAKYDTLVGERGSRFTGGQKQRFAIARALVRNPKILLLDEPTSALDTTDEKLVSDTLDKIRENRTTIILSSRPKPIKKADLVGVIHDGHMIEWGTHQELEALKGFYYNFMKLDEVDSNSTDDLENEVQA